MAYVGMPGWDSEQADRSKNSSATREIPEAQNAIIAVYALVYLTLGAPCRGSAKKD